MRTAMTMRTAFFTVPRGSRPPRLRARAGARSVSRASVPLAIKDPSAEHAELHEREGQDDEGEQEGHRRAEPQLGLLEERTEHEHGHRARRVERTAVREDVDLVEDP